MQLHVENVSYSVLILSCFTLGLIRPNCERIIFSNCTGLKKTGFMNVKSLNRTTIDSLNLNLIDIELKICIHKCFSCSITLVV